MGRCAEGLERGSTIDYSNVNTLDQFNLWRAVAIPRVLCRTISPGLAVVATEDTRRWSTTILRHKSEQILTALSGASPRLLFCENKRRSVVRMFLLIMETVRSDFVDKPRQIFSG